MKKKNLLLLLLTAALSVSCGGDKKDNDRAAQTSEQAETKGPQDADKPLNRTYTATIGGKSYEISVNRSPDHELPTVKDQLDQEFYDNSVRVSITNGGNEIFARTFTKEAFADYLSEADKNGMVLLGMAYDEEKTTGSRICLAAQIGQPGMGEGPAFTIEISADGSSCSIVRDMQQDTNASDAMGD